MNVRVELHIGDGEAQRVDGVNVDSRRSTSSYHHYYHYYYHYYHYYYYYYHYHYQ